MGSDRPIDVINLLSASYAKSSWSKLVSAMNAVQNFASEKQSNVPFPISQNNLLNFVAWGHTVKKWKSSTISSYVDSIAVIHKLRGLDDSICNNWLTKRLIKGVHNLSLYTVNPLPTRKVMSLPLLVILCDQISKTDWSPESKQIVWTAATLAFFGAMRFGELLPKNKHSYCPEDTLLWSDIRTMDDDSFLIHVKTPKSKASEGEFIDIFKFEGFGTCPVAALSRLKLISDDSPERPVFMFPNGHCLTQACMNSLIRSLLRPLIGTDADSLSCHSFRGAIPSALGKCPDISKEDTQGWGRWSSSAYLLYSRLKIDQKRAIFSRISKVLGMQAGRLPSQLPL